MACKSIIVGGIVQSQRPVFDLTLQRPLIAVSDVYLCSLMGGRPLTNYRCRLVAR